MTTALAYLFVGLILFIIRKTVYDHVCQKWRTNWRDNIDLILDNLPDNPNQLTNQEQEVVAHVEYMLLHGKIEEPILQSKWFFFWQVVDTTYVNFDWELIYGEDMRQKILDSQQITAPGIIGWERHS